MTDDVQDPPGSFGHGIAIGIAITMVLVHIGLVAMSGNLEQIYRDMGHLELPLLTRIAISRYWQGAVPLVGVLAIGALIIRRPRSLAPYAVVAIVFAAAAVATYILPSLPMMQLAGNISG